MKIVFAASEAAPYLKTGGLGDVAQALPAALARQADTEVFLFLPYYGKMKADPSIPVEFVKSFGVDLAWRRQHVGLFRVKNRARKLRVYLIDNEYYFKRDGVYGYPDDGERFAYFSRALLESLVQLDLHPDVIHCNDWQTALVPLFLHSFYQESLGGAKTVFSIHNIEYQGKADPYFIPDVLGLPASCTNTLLFDGCVNFLKSAILSSDAVTTVSRTYAEELFYPYYAHGLDGVIRDHAFKLRGIVNGIDVKQNNPAHDPNLAQPYTAQTLREGKAANKRALQEKTGLARRADVPLIGLVSRLAEHKGLDLIAAVLEELMRWDVQLCFLGTGEARYERLLRDCAAAHPDRFSMNLAFSTSLASQIYAASDLYLMPSKSEPCGLSQLIAMRYGAVPVVHAVGGLKDTVPPYEGETGSGFTFQSYNAGDMLGALSRALGLYGGDRPAWDALCVRNMRRDFSWDKPALEYRSLYNQLTGQA